MKQEKVKKELGSTLNIALNGFKDEVYSQEESEKKTYTKEEIEKAISTALSLSCCNSHNHYFNRFKGFLYKGYFIEK